MDLNLVGSSPWNKTTFTHIPMDLVVDVFHNQGLDRNGPCRSQPSVKYLCVHNLVGVGVDQRSRQQGIERGRNVSADALVQGEMVLTVSLPQESCFGYRELQMQLLQTIKGTCMDFDLCHVLCKSKDPFPSTNGLI